MDERQVDIACSILPDDIHRLRDRAAGVHFIVHNDNIVSPHIANEGQRFGVGVLVIAWLAVAWTSVAFAVAVPLALAVSEVVRRRREEAAYAVDDLDDLY